jgi:hypothetical protein
MAAGSAVIARRVACALALFAVLAAGWLAHKPAIVAAKSPGSVASATAGIGPRHQAGPDAYNHPGELPYAISRKQTKRLRAPDGQSKADKDRPSADTDAPVGQAALDRHRSRLGRLVAIVDRPAVPPRGYRFLTRAPPGVAAC